MHDKLIDMLFDQQDITWQNMIFDAVKKEEMNPWDVDITALAKRFLEMIRQLKEMDFKISGKIILAAAILLRLKSNKLLTDDLGELDRLIAMSEESGEEFYEELEERFLEKGRIITDQEKFKLIPRTPQPRKRKVSVYDLVEALQQALDVRKRRLKKHIDLDHTDVVIPEKKHDITDLIGHIYEQVLHYFMSKNLQKMTFSQLVPSDSREDKIYTFIPLLHLTHQQKVSLQQEYHLADIDIYVPGGKVITPELIKQEVQDIKASYKAEIERQEKEPDFFEKAKLKKAEEEKENDKTESKDKKGARASGKNAKADGSKKEEDNEKVYNEEANTEEVDNENGESSDSDADETSDEKSDKASADESSDESPVDEISADDKDEKDIDSDKLN